MNDLDQLTGLIVCGGKSSRMGSDKGLLLKEGKTWADRPWTNLSKWSLPVRISINPLQKEAYRKLFDTTLLIEDEVNIPGPLAGLFSAHRLMADRDLLLLACDMTDISSDSIQQLIEAYRKEKENFDFFVFKNGEEYEPILAIYSSNGLLKAHTLFQEDKLEKYSMKYLLEKGRTFSILIKEEQKKEFRNYNSKEDLR